jgi:uncharacterized protein YdaU (DUF1376 family)
MTFINRRKREVAKNPVEWVKYHAAKMGFLLMTRLHARWPAHGAASVLMHHYLANGEPLPDDDAKLAILAGGTVEQWQEVSAIVRSLFHLEGDGLLHQRELDDMLDEASEYLAMKRAAGSAGGRAKAENTKVVPIRKKDQEA